VDIYGRVKGVAESAPAASGSWSRVFTGPRTAFGFTVPADASGRFRISYRGDLGLEAADGYGLIPMPSSVRVAVDEETVESWAVLDGLHLAGLEAVTPSSYGPGAHAVTVTSEAELSGPGMLDVRQCQ
jgi:hypothetical protein